MSVEAAIVVVIDEGQPTGGPAALHDLCDSVVVRKLLTSMAQFGAPNAEACDRNDEQPDDRENGSDGPFVTEERGGATPTTSRNERRVTDDLGGRHRLSKGICIHHRGRDEGGNVGDGVARLVGGRQIHRVI